MGLALAIGQGAGIRSQTVDFSVGGRFFVRLEALMVDSSGPGLSVGPTSEFSLVFHVKPDERNRESDAGPGADHRPAGRVHPGRRTAHGPRQGLVGQWPGDQGRGQPDR